VTAREHAGGGLVYRECSRFLFRNNDVEGIGATYISPNDNGQDFGIGGFSDDILRMDIVGSFVNNRIRETAFGIFSNRHSALNLQDNQIYDIRGQHGFYIIESSGINVSGNTVRRCAQQGFKLQLEEYESRGLAPVGTGNHKGLNVAGNVFDACQDAAVVLYSPPAPGNQIMTGVQIGPNVVTNMTQDGYTLDRCKDFHVAAHTVSDCARHPLRWRESNGVIDAGFTALRCGSGMTGRLLDDMTIGAINIIDCGATGSSIYNMPFTIEDPVNPPASAKAAPLLDIDGMNIAYTTGDTAGANIGRVFDADVLLKIRRTKTTSPKAFRHDGTLVEALANQFNGFAAGAQNSPTTFLAGNIGRVFYGQQDPSAAGSSAAFIKGDFCHNTGFSVDASNMVLLGWICSVAGSPGTWVAVRTSTVSPAT
jgi:hypothetical protein